MFYCGIQIMKGPSMNKHLLTFGLLSLLPVNTWCTTIINKGDTTARVIVSYQEGGCKPNSKELKPDESLYVNQTCKRNTIEVIYSDGYSKTLVTGGYNEDGEIITFQHDI